MTSSGAVPSFKIDTFILKAARGSPFDRCIRTAVHLEQTYFGLPFLKNRNQNAAPESSSAIPEITRLTIFKRFEGCTMHNAAEITGTSYRSESSFSRRQVVSGALGRYAEPERSLSERWAERRRAVRPGAPEAFPAQYAVPQQSGGSAYL
jgi:hypothetical protein